MVFLTGAARHGHLMDETRLRTAITGIANEAARDGRRLAYAVIDENGLRPGLTVEDIYARYVRPSIAGTAMEKPVFDRSIMDHNAINTLRQKCGMTLMRFTAEPEWKEFYNRTYDSITRSRQQNGPSARPF